MDYSESLAYISKCNEIGSLMGLDRIRELLKRLGNPETKIPIIHIAGTNGKGSILSYVEEVLVGSGLKVGRYISPAIFDYRDRWRINKENISEELCAKLMTDIQVFVEEMTADGFQHPSSFEIETALAFHMFVEENCDIALVECGMGGEEDATNVIDAPMSNVLSSVSLDHMNELGSTIAEITRNKLGIVRDSTDLVLYPVCDEAYQEVVKCADERNLRLHYADINKLEIVAEHFTGSDIIYEGYSYRVPIGGRVQILNAITAIEILKVYNEKAELFGLHNISHASISDGIANTKWPGRFTVLEEAPLFIIDGAHNRDAWISLGADIRKYFTKLKPVLIMGVLKDKEFEVMIRELAPLAGHIITITPKNSRGMDGKELCGLIRDAGCEAEYIDDINEAVSKAKDLAGDNGVVIALGSLSYIGELF